MKRGVLLLILALLAVQVFSQRTGEDTHSSSRRAKRAYHDTVWTIRGITPLDSRFRKWKFDFVLDARQTLVSNTRVRLAGLRLGLEHRRVHRFGVGLYNLGDGVRVNSLTTVDPRINDATLSLSYLSLFYERVLFFSRKWEWSVTGHTGAGEITGNYSLDGKEYTFRQRVNPLEISSILYFNLTYFVSIGAGVGYRSMRFTPEEIRPLYNAPVGILRVRVKLLKMTKGFFSKEVRDSY